MHQGEKQQPVQGERERFDHRKPNHLAVDSGGLPVFEYQTPVTEKLQKRADKNRGQVRERRRHAEPFHEYEQYAHVDERGDNSGGCRLYQTNGVKKSFHRALYLSALFLFVTIQSARAEVSSPFPVTSKMDGTRSLYTPQMEQLMESWPKGRDFCHAQTLPLEVQTIGVRTPDRPYYVGFKKCMVIHAPLKQVVAVKDDVPHYLDLFPGFRTIKKISEDQNRMTLQWERDIGVFFVPNIVYRVNYVREVSDTRAVYRWQFLDGDRILFSDGVEVLESLTPTTTLFSNYEFFEADYGIGLFGLKAMSSDGVWDESRKGSYRSIFAIRFKAEHPDWDYERVRQESEALAEKAQPQKIDFQSTL